MYTLTSAVYAVLIAFVINIILCPVIIPFLTKLKFGQYVRSDGPKTHLKKAGTPTMGGIMIIGSFIFASLFFIKDNKDGIVILLVTVGFGIIGFLDDFIKIIKKRSMGLSSAQKFIAQLVVTTLFVVYLVKSPNGYFGGSATELIVPFGRGAVLDLGYLYIPFIYFAMMGTVNGANFTDGLDGLASGVTVIIVTFFLFVSWAAGSTALPLAGAAVGSLLGFLLYNSHPARVFMGDTGSLALGGFVACLAILLKMPLFILLVCIIYVIEILSVMIQVSYFKLTKRRFFKMAPIHHSFELSGWSETKIVALAYIVTAIACLIGYLGSQHIFI